MAMRLRSFSKINLGLGIGPVRGDGFHELVTVYQTVGLYDVVTVEARRAEKTRIMLTSNDARVPMDGRNTAWRMVEGALGRMGLAAEVSVHIEKRLPVQGGMGAGSANAAAALVGLERELGVRLGEAERMEVAAGVGSDVPLFLVGGTVLGEGRGERVRGLGDLGLTGEADAAGGAREGGGVACVMAVPEVGVSTPAAFRAWDGLRLGEAGGDAGLTARALQGRLHELSLVYSSVFGFRAEGQAKVPDTSGTVGGLTSDEVLLRERTGAGDSLAENSLLALVRTGIENDFEEVVFPHHPLLRSTKRLLMGSDTGAPAVYAAMSGSGSALFGLYRSEEEARAAQQRVQASGVRALLTMTLGREAYWAAMLREAD